MNICFWCLGSGNRFLAAYPVFREVVPVQSLVQQLREHSHTLALLAPHNGRWIQMQVHFILKWDCEHVSMYPGEPH
jgi:hypothetical protein